MYYLKDWLTEKFPLDEIEFDRIGSICSISDTEGSLQFIVFLMNIFTVTFPLRLENLMLFETRFVSIYSNLYSSPYIFSKQSIIFLFKFNCIFMLFLLLRYSSESKVFLTADMRLKLCLWSLNVLFSYFAASNRSFTKFIDIFELCIQL